MIEISKYFIKYEIEWWAGLYGNYMAMEISISPLYHEEKLIELLWICEVWGQKLS